MTVNKVARFVGSQCYFRAYIYVHVHLSIILGRNLWSTLQLCCVCRVFRCSRLPRFVLVENVKGFETSQMRSELVAVLTSLDFHYQVTYVARMCQYYR